MAIEIGALRALLSLDSAAFDSGAARAQASMGRLKRSMVKAGQEMRRVGRSMTLRMTLPMAAMGTIAIRSSLKTIDAQSKMAQSLGTSTRSMQVLGRAADRAGLSTGEVDQITLQLTKRLSQAATGTGPAVKALDALGLSASDLISLDLDQQIGTINAAIAEGIPVAEQAAIAAQLFGDRAGVIADRLDADTIAKASAEIERFGVAVSEVDADKIEEANDAMSALGLVGKGLANQLTVALAPALTSLAETAASVSEWFSALEPSTQRMIGISVALAAALGPVSIALGLVVTGLAALASPIGAAILAFGAVAAGVATVVLKWDDWAARFPVLQAGFDLATSAIKGFADLVLPLLTLALDTVNEALRGVVSLLLGDFDGALASNRAIVANFAGYFRDVFGVDLPDAIRSAINGVKKAISDLGGALVDAVRGLASDMIAAGKQLGQDLIDGLKAGIDARISAVKQKLKDAADSVTSLFKFQWKVRSPSRVFKEIGGDLIDGLVIGIDDNTDKAKSSAERTASAVNSAFDDLGNGSFDGALDTLLTDLDRVAESADRVAGSVEGIFSGFTDGLAGGDLAGGLKSLFDDVLGAGAQSLSSLFSSSFAAGGGGFGGIISGLSNSLKSGFGALSSLGSGAGLAGIGSAVTSFLPVIGAVSGVVNLIKGFSSKTTIGGGLNLGIDGNGVNGGTFDTIRKTSFWGLRKRTYDVEKEFDAATQELFGAQADALRATVTETYTALGLSVSEAMLNGVSVATQRIDTTNLSQDEIDAKVQEIFTSFGDAMSRAIGGVDLQSAIDLNQVQSVLDVLGQAFDVLSDDGAVARAVGASDGLLAIAGGIDALARKAGAFYEGFFSDTEKLENVQGNVADTFARLGVAVPATDDAFRDLVLTQDLLTDAGRRTYNALLDIAPSFDVVTDAIEAASEAARLADENLQALVASAQAQQGDLVFDLQPQATQLDLLKAKLSETFSSLGFSLPGTLDGLRAIVAGLDVSVDAGRDALSQIAAILPDFRQVFGALTDLRPALQLDANVYQSEFEARFAAGVASAGQFSNEAITAQNAEAARQTSLLEGIMNLLDEQTRTANAALNLSQFEAT